MTPHRFQLLLTLLTGVFLGAAGHALLHPVANTAVAETAKPAPDVATLAAEIESIKGKLPDQAHAMQDVGYHFSNLWFAGQREHWDLANFYWLETRSHLRWAIRIIPLRKDNAGNDVDVQDILTGFENGPLKELEEAIAAKDKTLFEKRYRSTLENCYSCHKTADKPFIRPQMPTQAETHIINFDPSANWPL
ncbi:MAG TPA: hypothetical protein VJ828_13190 [Lacipirellulaceae bacterium]|nr:hypothetical protein [Lacipirellulaceae bacterium]